MKKNQNFYDLKFRGSFAEYKKRNDSINYPDYDIDQEKLDYLSTSRKRYINFFKDQDEEDYPSPALKNISSIPASTQNDSINTLEKTLPSLLTSGIFDKKAGPVPINNAQSACADTLDTIFQDMETAFRDARIKNLNAPNDLEAELDFNEVKRKLSRNPDINPVLLNLPEIARHEALRADNPDVKKAFTILQQCFIRWLANEKTGVAKPYWVDFDWATNFTGAQSSMEDLKKNLNNEAASEVLKTKLKKIIQDEVDKGNDANEMDFDFTKYPPEKWDERSFQSRGIIFYSISNILMDIKSSRFKLLPPQYVALGNFAIHALPKGKIIKNGRGGYAARVTDVYFFVKDSFNFDGNQFLGTWDDVNMKALALWPGSKFIGNIDFREFREKTGYGLDFQILSPLRKVENFEEFELDLE